jgi:L-ribulose-5-phosphate 3-epimerase
MGTPDLDLDGAIDLFASIGMDGIEIRCADDGHLDTERVTSRTLARIRRRLDEAGIEPVCLTPYYRDFVSEAREREILALKRVVEVAAELGCPRVRLYGGIDPTSSPVEPTQTWARTVTGIRIVADHAADNGVACCIETHDGSLTFCAADAVRMVRDVDRPNVGILLDFAWVYGAGRESAAEAVAVCRPYLIHCHYKDWLIEETDAGPSRRARLMGEGSIPWPEFFRHLVASGYEGPLTDEYERYWHPEDLPAAEDGMRRNLAYVKRHMEIDTTARDGVVR